jgi:gamma-glutamyltranspeptidase/glutathione hydrolase
VDVPGVVEGWHQLLARFGSIGLGDALQPAVHYARAGFPVQELMAAEWRHHAAKLAQDPAAAMTFLPGGRTPAEGEMFANPNLARSLSLIAAGGRDAFYVGDLARAIVDDMQARDGLLTMEDFTGTRRTGSLPSAPPIEATTCSRCRPARRDLSPSRC